ncbi:MAG: dipeptidase [Candidatus Woesearchaeota archaeon]|nr:dipeptidase [Candidatus Woesearchaeota archaeon]
MKIILSGGGSGEDTKEVDEKFASLLDKNKPLLYIPIAIDNIKHPYPDCLKWLRLTFDNFGIKNYEMWTEGDLKKSKDVSPSNFSGIYIGGGNTPYLLKKLKETGFWEFLKEAIESDIPIYGGSAGATIFSKTIKYSLYSDKNWVGINELTGMNVLSGYEIMVHYKKEEKDKLINISEENKSENIIALTEKNGLYVNSKEVVVIGKEPAFVFNNGKIRNVPVGEVLLIKPNFKE